MKPLPRSRSGCSLEYCFARRRGALDRTSYAFFRYRAREKTRLLATCFCADSGCYVVRFGCDPAPSSSVSVRRSIYCDRSCDFPGDFSKGRIVPRAGTTWRPNEAEAHAVCKPGGVPIRHNSGGRSELHSRRVESFIALDLRYSWAESCVLSALARRDTIAQGLRGAPHCRPQVAAPTMYVSVTSNWTHWSTVCRRCGFAVDAQARSSGTALALAPLGIFPTYHEKNQAGLRILDRQGRPLRKSASRRRRIRISRRLPRWSSTPCCLSRIASC
jgi:hypothetical protein